MNALITIVLVFQPLFFYRRHLFRLTAHIPFDIGEFHLPLAAFLERSATGRLWPFWNPQLYGGFPTHADIQAALFYPFTWLAISADLATGGGRLFYWLEWLVPIHMIIAGAGAYLLFRQLRCSPFVALFGATTYQIGPFFVSQAQHLGAICTAAWFPFILLCLCRLAEGFRGKPAAALALAVCLAILSGFPAAMIVVLVLSGLFCLGLIAMRAAKPSLLLSFAAASLAGFDMSAVQLLPTMQLASLSVASLRYKWAGNGGGMHWHSLVSFVWPNYYGIFSAWDGARYQLPFNFTFMFTFCGYAAAILILLAFVFARRVKLLALSGALLLVSAIWMLGENTPVYTAIFKRLPHSVQNPLYPEFALLGFGLFAALTATLVLSRLESGIPRYLLIAVVAANSWNLIRTGANRVFNTFEGGYRMVGSGSTDVTHPVSGELQKLTRTTNPPSRIDFFSETAGLLQILPGVFDIPSAAGDNPFLLLRYYSLRHAFSGEPEWSRRQFPRDFNPWLEAENVSYVLEDAQAGKRQVDEQRLEFLPFDSFHVYRVKRPVPRFNLLNSIVAVTDSSHALDEVKRADFDPAAKAVVENPPENWAPLESARGMVSVLRYENNRVDIDVETSGPTLLVTSESIYPGWTATVNGVATPILATNVAFRGVPLRAGTSHVVMQYFPERFILSILITVLACAIVVCGVLFD